MPGPDLWAAADGAWSPTAGRARRAPTAADRDARATAGAGAARRSGARRARAGWARGGISERVLQLGHKDVSVNLQKKFVNLAGTGREPTRNAWSHRAATRNNRGRPRRPHRGATSPVTAECGVGRDHGSIRLPKFEGAAIAVKPTLGSISNFGYWKPITTVHDGTSPRPRARGCGGNEACRQRHPRLPHHAKGPEEPGAPAAASAWAC